MAKSAIYNSFVEDCHLCKMHYYFAYCMSVCIHVSVCKHTSKIRHINFTKFSMHVAVACSSSGAILICYVLSDLWMMPHLHIGIGDVKRESAQSN